MNTEKAKWYGDTIRAVTGGSAKTLRGLLAAARAHIGTIWHQKTPEVRATKTNGMRWRTDHVDRSWTRAEYQRIARKKRLGENTPEQRRSRHDPRFRKNRLARLRRAIKKLSQPVHVKDVSENWHQHVNAIAVDIRKSGGRPISGDARTWGYLNIDANECDRRKIKISRRGKDWEIILGTLTFLHYEEPETEWKNRKPVAYTRAVTENHIRSLYLIVDNGCSLETDIDGELKTLYAQDGAMWAVDDLGVHLRPAGHNRWEYHIDASDVREWTADIGAKRLRDAEKSYRDRMALKKIEAARLAGVWICKADSVKAGNCRAGTETWMQQHGLIARHYPAIKISAMRNGNAHYVDAAIAIAVKRHAAETNRGFAILAEHK